MTLTNSLGGVSPGLHGRVIAVLGRTTTALTGRTIASLVRPEASQSGVQRVLDDLVRHGLVRSEPAGSAKLYTMNRRHLAYPAIDQLVHLREALLTHMQEEADSWEVPAGAIWLFGSTARGEADAGSDIDVFVLRRDEIGDSDRQWQDQLDALTESVSGWTGNRCEILELSQAELKAAKRRGDRIVSELARDAVPVSGASPRQIIGRPPAGRAGK